MTKENLDPIVISEQQFNKAAAYITDLKIAIHALQQPRLLPYGLLPRPEGVTFR